MLLPEHCFQATDYDTRQFKKPDKQQQWTGVTGTAGPGANSPVSSQKKHKIIILQVSPDSLQVSASGAHMHPPPPPRPPSFNCKKNFAIPLLAVKNTVITEALLFPVNNDKNLAVLTT